MSESNIEHEEEYESYLDPSVPNEDDEFEYEFDEGEGGDTPRTPNQNGARSADDILQAKDAQIADLNKRLGDAIRVGGERRKTLEDELARRDAEIDGWLEKVGQWQGSELNAKRQESYDEGVRFAEDKLLSRLLPEDKADYLEDIRKSPKSVSPLQPVALPKRVTTPPPSAVNSEVSDVVEQFTALGVPIAEIEQTSVGSVTKSATAWLKSHKGELDSDAADEAVRVQRDESGATRVTPGNTSTPAPIRINATKRLEEIEQELRAIKQRRLPNAMAQAGPLLAERARIQVAMAARRQR